MKGGAAKLGKNSKLKPIPFLQNFQSLAGGLPYAKHQHSRLICAITKELMNENNPPMVLPSGTVYSEKAIQQHTKQGQFIDPISGVYVWTCYFLYKLYTSAADRAWFFCLQGDMLPCKCEPGLDFKLLPSLWRQKTVARLKEYFETLRSCRNILCIDRIATSIHLLRG